MLRVLAIASLTLLLACTADGDPVALGDPPPGPGGVDDEDEVGDDDDGPPDEYWADAPDAPPGGLKILIEPIVVPAGSEALMCLFGTFEDDLAVEAFSFHQTPGFGHHMVLNSYEADEPFEDGTLTDCLPAQIDRSSPIFLTQAMAPDDPGLTVASFIPGGTA